MKNITSVIDRNVFDLAGVGLLIMSAYVQNNSDGAGHHSVRYELLNEKEREEWFIENTPCCGDRNHIGWSCDDKGCYPF